MIRVTRLSNTDPMAFEVVVGEDRNATRHRVTLSTSTFNDLCQGKAPAEACVEAAFRFLLDREPRESILASFDISVISRYFPEFDRKFSEYLRT